MDPELAAGPEAREEHEEYAVDWTTEEDLDFYNRGADAPVASPGAPLRDEHLRWLREIGMRVHVLRAGGMGAREVVSRVGLRDPAKLRRLEAVMDWLEAAAAQPARSAPLARLSTPVFLAVVSRGITGLEDLEERLPDLEGRPAFPPEAVEEIRALLREESTPQQGRSNP